MNKEEHLIPLDEEVSDIADFFKVFGDSTRLKILFLLEHGELPVHCFCFGDATIDY